MIAAAPADLRRRAEAWAAALGRGQVIAGESTVGGGSLPGETLPTFLLAIETTRPDRLLARLRQARPAIIARVEDACVVFDPRAVLSEQEDDLLAGIRAAMENQ
jgi:L-seryl-tRNA(Ser) seleniumtransferase